MGASQRLVSGHMPDRKTAGFPRPFLEFRPLLVLTTLWAYCSTVRNKNTTCLNNLFWSGGLQGLGGNTLSWVVQVQVTENGIRYWVSPSTGQKTGFFADQRESRLIARHLSRGKAVLDLGCYTGGFALNALAGGASHVTGGQPLMPIVLWAFLAAQGCSIL